MTRRFRVTRGKQEEEPSLERESESAAEMVKLVLPAKLIGVGQDSSAMSATQAGVM